VSAVLSHQSTYHITERADL